MDYDDMIYDQTFKTPLKQKTETIQHDAALATTGKIRGFSMEKLYQKLGIETLQQEHWYRKLCCF